MFSVNAPDLTKEERYHRYAFAQLSEAVRLLCVEPGTVKNRLWSAFQVINKIDINSLPDSVRENLSMANKEATKFTKNGKPDLQSTLNRIHNKTGTKIASRILKAKVELESYIS
jgi:hypothetical protein